MTDKPKTVNGLMKYMRNQKGMRISGTIQKNDLLNMGYYHGFKGYRYIGKPSKIITYTDFEQLKAIYDFDRL